MECDAGELETDSGEDGWDDLTSASQRILAFASGLQDAPASARDPGHFQNEELSPSQTTESWHGHTAMTQRGYALALGGGQHGCLNRAGIVNTSKERYSD